MTISLKPAHLKRYKDIAWLLVKYGRGDLASRADLQEDLSEEQRVTASAIPGPRSSRATSRNSGRPS